MNVVTDMIADVPAGVAVINDASQFDALLQPECAAVVCRRQMPGEVEGWLQVLPEDRLPRGRVILPPAAVAEAVDQLGNIAELPEGPERNWLQADIAALAEEFAKVLSANFLRLRLDVIATNACRRFHVDAISARLICTYRGTGTQYGVARDGADPERIFTVPTGAPALLRGSRWPEVPASGVLHRSPPIEGTAETRLVLVLDEVADPDTEE